jgi:hypothetical protein
MKNTTALADNCAERILGVGPFVFFDQPEPGLGDIRIKRDDPFDFFGAQLRTFITTGPDLAAFARFLVGNDIFAHKPDGLRVHPLQGTLCCAQAPRVSSYRPKNKGQQDKKYDKKPDNPLIRVPHPAQKPPPGTIQTFSAKMAQQSVVVIDRVTAMRANILAHQVHLYTIWP